jgi:hypothetical protein
VNENGTAIVPVVITRSGGNQGSVSVTLTASNGTATAINDYDNTPIAVDFTDGQISKVVNLPIINDNEPESNETITLTLTNPTGGAILGSQSTATLTILANDGLVPDFAGNSLSNARDISVLNGTQAFTDYVDAVDKDDYYRFEFLKESIFELTLNGLVTNTSIELIDSAGLVITNAIASNSLPGTIQQTLDTGVYYIRVYRQSGETNYNLTVKGTPLPKPFQISSVTPDSGSNSGQITLTIEGNQFTNNATVTLLAPDSSSRNATDVLWLNDTTLIATFSLEGLEEGSYDVKVTDTAGTIQSNNIFNVGSTGEGRLETFVDVTSRLRPWNIGEVTVTYTNVGDADLPAPLFSLTLLSTSGFYWD